MDQCRLNKGRPKGLWGVVQRPWVDAVPPCSLRTFRCLFEYTVAQFCYWIQARVILPGPDTLYATWEEMVLRDLKAGCRFLKYDTKEIQIVNGNLSEQEVTGLG